MANPIALVSEEGEVLMTVSAVTDSGKECIFSDKEFSEEKELIFETKGNFMYVIKNKTDVPVYFTIEDQNGKTINTSDFIGPSTKFHVHRHAVNDKILEFEPDNTFTFTIKGVVGTWKVSEDEGDKRVVYKNIPGSSKFSFSHILEENIVFLTKETGNKIGYIENNCCICLNKERDKLCRLVKCGHKCVHMNCFFENGLPNFMKCPLCRANIVAVAV
jgi:hypothetical protein